MSRLHESIMRVLLSDIVSGRVKVGGWLPRETDIAGQFGVSRGVARECIRGLEERGMVTVKHGRGATVKPEDRWNVLDPDVLGALLDSGGGAAILREYLESRRILEIAAAGLAAERAEPAHLTALSDAFDRMVETADRAADNPAAEDLYHEADIAFHRALVAARRPLARPDARLERSLPEHRRILTAVAQAEPEAARQAMRDHLLTVEAYLRDYAGDAAVTTDPAAGD